MMKIANAPCSWGVLEFGIEGETDTFSKVLNEMKDSGYAGTELGDWGFLPTNPDDLGRELDKRALSMVGAFVPVNFSDATEHLSGARQAIKVAQLLAEVSEGQARIVLADMNGSSPVRTRFAGEITEEMGLSDEGWKIFADGVNYVARSVFRETGLICVFHHHCAGYVETRDEIQRLMDLTDPDTVGLCFDTGHYAFGGSDPVEGLKTFAQRTKHIHFKDFNPKIAERKTELGWDYFKAVEHGVFCELGKGSVDFKSIHSILKDLNYDSWIVVEQDIIPGMGSPFKSAVHNREYLKSIGL